MAPVVHLRDAVALLGRFPALAGATLQVSRGELLLVRGANGAVLTVSARGVMAIGSRTATGAGSATTGVGATVTGFPS